MIRTTARGVVILLALFAAPASAADGPVWSALADGGVLLVRHAQTVPGTGDPAGFDLTDCSTQRNLDARGEAQAMSLGEALRQADIEVGSVLSSPWCRAKDTARLMQVGEVAVSPLLASVWNDEVQMQDRSGELRALIAAWRGPGALVLVTHGINIRRLIGRSAGQGGGYVLMPEPESEAGLKVVGSLP